MTSGCFRSRRLKICRDACATLYTTGYYHYASLAGDPWIAQSMKQSPELFFYCLTCICRNGMLTLALYLRHTCELGFMTDAVAVVY